MQEPLYIMLQKEDSTRLWIYYSLMEVYLLQLIEIKCQHSVSYFTLGLTMHNVNSTANPLVMNDNIQTPLIWPEWMGIAMLSVPLRYAYSTWRFPLVQKYFSIFFFHLLSLCSAYVASIEKHFLINLYSESNLFVLWLAVGTLWAKHTGSICSTMGAKRNVLFPFL